MLTKYIVIALASLLPALGAPTAQTEGMLDKRAASRFNVRVEDGRSLTFYGNSHFTGLVQLTVGSGQTESVSINDNGTPRWADFILSGAAGSFKASL